MILLVVDPSIVKSGWCIRDGDKYIASGVMKTKRDTKLSDGENLNNRLRYLAEETNKLIKEYNVDVMLTEEQFLKRNVKAMKTLVAARVAVCMPAIVKGLRVDYVEPSVWQSYCFGNKKVPDTKIASKEYAARHKDNITDDEADAICMSDWFLAKELSSKLNNSNED